MRFSPHLGLPLGYPAESSLVLRKLPVSFCLRMFSGCGFLWSPGVDWKYLRVHRLSSLPRGIKPQLPIANLLINTPDTGFPPSFVSHLSQCIYSFIELILDSINAHKCPLQAVHFWTLDLSPRQLSLKLCLNLRPQYHS